MSEYIERDALIERFRKRIRWLEKDVHDQYSLGLFHGCEFDANLINEIPAADVAPVIHGRWVMTLYTTTSKRGRIISNRKFTCSECAYSNGRKQANYCPNCGCCMDGGNE